MNVQEDDRPAARDPSGATSPFQFGLRSLLILMLVCAVILSLVKLLLPAAGVRAGLLVATYFMALATYGVLRVDHLWHKFGPGSTRWRKIQERREELAAMASRRRNEEP